MDFNRLFRFGLNYIRLYEWVKDTESGEPTLKYSQEYEKIKHQCGEKVNYQMKLEQDSGMGKKFTANILADS